MGDEHKPKDAQAAPESACYRLAMRVGCLFGRHRWQINQYQPLNLGPREASFSCVDCQKHAVGWVWSKDNKGISS